MDDMSGLPSTLVWHAQGMVSVQAGCELPYALMLMNERARVEGCSVEEIASQVVGHEISFGAATNEEIHHAIRERFADGGLFTASMVANEVGVSIQEVMTALATLEEGQLLFQGRIEFLDANGEHIGPAYAYKYFGHR
ncbi:MAG: hypothetical protein ACLPVY_27810 [Acidimicrobiia bacterium]